MERDDGTIDDGGHDLPEAWRRPACDRVREHLSAELDGERSPAPMAAEAADAHLDECPSCRTWFEGAVTLRRVTRIGAPEAAPDLRRVVLQRAGVPDLGRGEWVRALLGAIAGTLVLVNLPLLVLGQETGATEHVGRHLGAFGVALGIGFGYAAWRPERALGLLPLAGALGAALAVTAVIDSATGASAFGSEIVHLLELAGVVVLWILSGGRHRLAGRFEAMRNHGRHRSAPGLRPIDR